MNTVTFWLFDGNASEFEVFGKVGSHRVNETLNKLVELNHKEVGERRYIPYGDAVERLLDIGMKPLHHPMDMLHESYRAFLCVWVMQEEPSDETFSKVEKLTSDWELEERRNK